MKILLTSDNAARCASDEEQAAYRSFDHRSTHCCVHRRVFTEDQANRGVVATFIAMISGFLLSGYFKARN
jgi:hypothetical protein